MSNDNITLKYQKLKIHFIYCGIISFLIAGAMFTAKNYSNNDMAPLFSFGATLVGIVLSVIAIFMSIIGESNMSSTKEKLVSTSEDLVKIKDELNNSIKDISEIVSIKEELIQGNRKILDKLDTSIKLATFSKNEHNIDYIQVFKDNYDDSNQAEMKKNILGILYFFKMYYIKKKQIITTENLVKIVHEDFKIASSKSIAGLLIGSSMIFISEMLNEEKFSKYVIDEFSKNEANKKYLDDYLQYFV